MSCLYYMISEFVRSVQASRAAGHTDSSVMFRRLGHKHHVPKDSRGSACITVIVQFATALMHWKPE